MRGRTKDIRIAAPDLESALQLIEKLRTVHAEVEPGSAPACFVRVELAGREPAEVGDVLTRVERWLDEHSVDETRVEIDGRAYSLVVA